jgi:Tol biopolymer transport system component
VYDRVLKTNILVSAGPNGLSSSNNPISLPKISADGTKVAFESATPGLAGPGDNRAGTSVYVRDLQTGTLTNISGANVGALSLKQISADGRYVFFTIPIGLAPQLHRSDLLQQVDSVEPPANGPFAFLASSADGSRVAYSASGLYFRDFSQPARVLISSSPVTPTTLLSADGSILAYFKSPNLIVTNIVTGETSSFGPVPTPTSASMSADGRIIAYAFRPQAIGAVSDVWFLDRVTGRTNLVSRSSGSVGGNDSSSAPVVSADGRFIAFESWASNLVPNDNNQQKDVFVYDRFTDRLTLVSHSIGSASSANSGSFNPQFAPAGPLLLFISGSSDLVDGDLNDDIDVFAARLDTTVQSGDSDGDGLDDAWERAAFSTLDFGPADDPDGDGATNAQEFAAGTNPSDATSVFALHVNTTSELGFKTAPGRTYQLEFRGSIDAGAWQSVGNTIVGDGNNASVPISNTSAQGFYRLRLVQ